MQQHIARHIWQNNTPNTPPPINWICGAVLMQASLHAYLNLGSANFWSDQYQATAGIFIACQIPSYVVCENHTSGDGDGDDGVMCSNQFFFIISGGHGKRSDIPRGLSLEMPQDYSNTNKEIIVSSFAPKCCLAMKREQIKNIVFFT